MASEITLRRMRFAVTAVIAIGLLSAMAFGQGPTIKQVNFTINVPYQMKMANYVLSPGKYIIRQVDQNNLALFWLYRGDLTHPPIAAISTVRAEYGEGRAPYPEKASIGLRYAESGDVAHPVVTGWEIPGEDGWRIIAVKASHKSPFLTRVD